MREEVNRWLRLGAILSACIGVNPASADETRLRMETVEASRPAAITMTAFADIVSDKTEGVKIDVFHGGIDTLGMMALGRGVLHMSMVTPVAYDFMSQTKGMFSQETVATELSKLVQLIMWFPYGSFHFAVRDESEIETLNDLAGRTVFLGPHHLSAPYHDASSWIEATTGLIAGDDYDAVTADWQTGVQMFRDGDVDAFVSACLGACALLSELSPEGSLRFIAPLSHDSATTDAFFTAGRSPATIASRMEGGEMSGEAITSFQTAAGIAVYSDVDSQTVYEMTKAYWENLDQLLPTEQRLSITYATTKRSAIKFHHGAARYYREIGAID